VEKMAGSSPESNVKTRLLLHSLIASERSLPPVNPKRIIGIFGGEVERKKKSGVLAKEPAAKEESQ
jgi:hypothetical protein